MRLSDEAAGTKVPGWAKFERARPFRRVTRRLEVKVNDSWNPYAKHWIEQLECGHRLTTYGPELNGKFAKQRKCRECAEALLAMQEAPATGGGDDAAA